MPPYIPPTPSFTIVSRSEWGAERARPHEPQTWTPSEGGVVIHTLHTDSASSISHTQCFAKMRTFQKSDMYQSLISDVPKMPDISHNYVVCEHGVVFEGRGISGRPFANSGIYPGNKNYYSLCVMVGKDDSMVDAVYNGLRNIIGYVRSFAGRFGAGDKIRGHDWDGCPGTRLRNMISTGSLDPARNPAPKELTIVSRAEWGALPPKSVQPTVSKSQRTSFAVHYSAGGDKEGPYGIQHWMMYGREAEDQLDDVGYNFLIDVNGVIYEGRGWHTLGAHIKGQNTPNIGVCVIGSNHHMIDSTGKIKEPISTALVSLYYRANEVMGKELIRTYHGKLEPGTECPGGYLAAWVEDGMPGDRRTVHGSVGSGYSGGGSGYANVLYRSVISQQRAVNGLGYTPPLAVDGVFGPLTEAGVRWLQRTVGVADDGMWGPLTEQAYLAYTGGYSRGETSVRSIVSQQQAVNSQGYSPALAVDGVFGPLTEAGVRWLQRTVGVADDGIWGPATEQAYLAHIGSAPGQDAGIVRSVMSQQQAVNQQGYTPPLTVDGEFGSLTEAGVRWLQRTVGVADDGIWGPATERAYLAHIGHDGTQSRGTTTVRPVSYQQGAVNDLGYTPPLAIDGAFGPLTDAGVRWLQRKVGVADDGLWGPATERAYNTYHDYGALLTVDGDFGPATISATQRAIGVEPDGVWGPVSRRETQRYLNERSGAGLIVDGDFGPASVRALQTYLNRVIGAGLTVDGDWGGGTTSALQRALNLAKF